MGTNKRVPTAPIGFVNRLFNAEQLSLTDEDFVKLLNAFRRHPEEQAELIAARCMDARIGPGADLVDS